MKRRSFLKGLAIACAGVATGASLLSDRCTAAEPKAPVPFDPVKYKGEIVWRNLTASELQAEKDLVALQYQLEKATQQVWEQRIMAEYTALAS